VKRFKRLTAKGSGEDGFTLLEVLVAAFILVLGALGVFMTFAAAVHNVQRSRDVQIASSVAQREMEKIRSLPYERVLNATTPEASVEVGSPATRVSGAEFGLKRDKTEKAPLAVAAAGTCTTEKPCVNSKPASSCVGGSSPGTFSNGSATGSVYCYVTTLKDEACERATSKTCSYKRIIVAVWLAKPSNEASRRPYYELQSSINPSS
jgi:prepilin-type N-terminal cleavage/methylation domain-containing protein